MGKVILKKALRYSLVFGWIGVVATLFAGCASMDESLKEQQRVFATCELDAMDTQGITVVGCGTGEPTRYQFGSITRFLDENCQASTVQELLQTLRKGDGVVILYVEGTNLVQALRPGKTLLLIRDPSGGFVPSFCP